jgi:hypothetical protein
MMECFRFCFIFFFAAALSLTATAQTNAQPELWGGYITSYSLNEKWALWNDFHFVPKAFWINRHGITRSIGEDGRLTAGYAYVLTASSFSTQLRRNEHRPWAQFEYSKPISEKIGCRARLRYDRRIREKVDRTDFAEGWIAYNRWRLMLSIRYRLSSYSHGRSLHLNLLNEILLNTGKQFDGNVLDQNRTYLMLSYSWPKVRLQCGPHIRAIPNASGQLNYRYGLTLWVIQRFDKHKHWPQP